MDPSRYSFYASDPAGNRVSQMLGYPEESGGVQYETAYGYNDLNQLVAQSLSWTDAPPDPESNGQSHSSSTTYGYDANGNRAVAVTSSDDSGDPAQESTTTYAYDTSDRLVRARYNGVSAFAAAYDARTRRLGKSEDESTPTFRYDGGTNFQELQDGQVTAELVRAGGLGGGVGSVLYSDKSMNPDDPGPVEHFAYNAVGHTVALTNDAGAVTQGTLYEAFGGTVAGGGAGNNRLANTKERDYSTGLDNHGFRYYDPAAGRYLTRDPLGYADGLNAYAHVGNNPVNKVDPLGLSGEDSKGRTDTSRLFHRQSFCASCHGSVGSGYVNLAAGGYRGPVSDRQMFDVGVADATAQRLSPVAQAGAEMGAGFIPVVGEVMDVTTMLDSNESTGVRVVAGVSLAANILTAGLLPNFGRAARTAARGSDEAAQAATNGSRSVESLSAEMGSRGTEMADPALLGKLEGRGYTILNDPDTVKYLDAGRANASTFRDGALLIRPDARKIEVLQEYLHNVQQQKGIADKLNPRQLEVHVKDFMTRHQKLLGINKDDAQWLHKSKETYESK